jgi:hypothetical protein
MAALFSDRAPKMIVFSFAIVACKASIIIWDGQPAA